MQTSLPPPEKHWPRSGEKSARAICEQHRWKLWLLGTALVGKPPQRASNTAATCSSLALQWWETRQNELPTISNSTGRPCPGERPFQQYRCNKKRLVHVGGRMCLQLVQDGTRHDRIVMGVVSEDSMLGALLEPGLVATETHAEQSQKAFSRT